MLQCCEHVRQITVVKEKGTKWQTTVGKILHRKLKIKQSEVKFADFLFYGFRFLKLNSENVYSATITILDNNWLYFCVCFQSVVKDLTDATDPVKLKIGRVLDQWAHPDRCE